MGLGITFNDIPKMSGGLWPEGTFLVKMNEGEVRYSATEKRMIWVNFVGDGEGVEGRQGFENIVIGVRQGDYAGKVTWDDPEADQNPETWKLFGPSKWKELLEACAFVGLESMDPSDHKVQEDLIARLPGSQCLVEIYNTTQKTGDYKGTEQNNFRFHKIGSRKIGVKGKSPMATAPLAAPPATPKPVAPSAPVQKEESADPGDKLIDCPVPGCEEKVPASKLGQHIAVCPAKK